MDLKFLVFLILATFQLAVRGDPIKATDEQTCIDLCSSCKGVAAFVEGKCECSIPENSNEGAECLARMKREAEDRGLDLLSCDLSTDKRTTRCTLGSKRLLTKNDIEQIAKYFMRDGPLTGSIFTAPPYTQAKSADCIGSSEIITQPAQTYYNPNMDYATQPQQMVSSPAISSPNSDCVGAPQQILSSPTPKKFVSKPLSKPLLAKPAPKQLVSSPKNDCVGSSRIITQPPETMSQPIEYEEPAPVISSPAVDDCAPTLGQPNTAAPVVGALNPLKTLGVPNITPALLRILTQHLSQPLLGIPQAVQTISQSPGISDLVSAPGHLLHSLMQRLNGNIQEVTNNGLDSLPKSESGLPKLELLNPPNDDTVSAPNPDCAPDSTVSAPNPTDSIPAIGYIGTPIISLLNPMAAPSPSHLSYVNPILGAPAPSTFANPTVGTAAPAQISYIHPIQMIPSQMISGIASYNNLVSHVPATTATYIVGSPLGLPYFQNLGTPAVVSNPAGPSSGAFEEHIVSQPNRDYKIEEPVLKPPKKCKKSTEEVSKKVTRDTKAVEESLNDETQNKELEQQFKIMSEKQTQTVTTEVPKIESITTQKPVMVKSLGQKLKADKRDKDVISKIKPGKEIAKKHRAERKHSEQKSDIKS